MKRFTFIPLPRFYYGILVLIILYCISFFAPWLYLPASVLLMCFAAAVLTDALYLFSQKNLFSAERHLPERLSLSDATEVEVQIKNLSNRNWAFSMTDELPYQLQMRNFNMNGTISGSGFCVLRYSIRPLERGEYRFGNINLFPASKLGFLSRHIVLPLEQTCAVYPSIVQMKAFELHTNSGIASSHGIRKMRRIGLSYEFEQIKPYVPGDDVRQINWRSSAKTRSLMLNQFEDEKSQQVYCIIDKSRSMLMPFNGLSLLDYAINSSLVICNTALKKHDKAGLLTFSDKIGTALRADNGSRQLRRIMEALYNQKERDSEASYEMLYQLVRSLIKTRSLLFLFTNFESLHALRRVADVLRKINKQHLLVPVFFENSELENLIRQKAETAEDVFTQIPAEQAVYDKRAIAGELRQLGMQYILCKPEELSMHAVNKYFEIKSRGIL